VLETITNASSAYRNHPALIAKQDSEGKKGNKCAGKESVVSGQWSVVGGQ
jgi:hypothetical protein